jgi:hypothetical protein
MASAFALLAVLLAAAAVRYGLRATRADDTEPKAAAWHFAALSIAGLALSAALAHYNLIGNHVP